MKFEKDPAVKKRLYFQLRKKAENAIPAINKITERYNKLKVKQKLLEMQQILKGDSQIPSRDKALQEIGSFLKKVDAFNHIYDRLALRMDVKPHQFDQLFKEGPVANDPEWKKTLKEIKWDSSHFHDFLTHFNDAFEPILLAKKALDEDPDSPELQEQLATALIVQEGKLTKLIAKNSPPYNLQNLQRLNEHLNSYKSKLSPEDPNLALLNDNTLLEDTANNFRLLRDLYQTQPHIVTYWRRGFVKEQLIAQVPGLDEAKWNHALKEQGLSTSDVRLVNAFYDQISKEAEPIFKLSREAAETPEKPSLIDKLIAKVKSKWNSFFGVKGLGNQTMTLDKLKKVQQAIDSVAQSLSEEIKNERAQATDSERQSKLREKERELARLKKLTIEKNVLAWLGQVKSLGNEFGLRP